MGILGCCVSLKGFDERDHLLLALVKRAGLLFVLSGLVGGGCVCSSVVCAADPLVPALKSPFSLLPSSSPEASRRHRALNLCLIFSAVKGMVTRRTALRNYVQIIYIGNWVWAPLRGVY